ncbi:hypothetical protein RCL1_007803 [Eukaryota sp. TZLM3-RCL]
MTTLYLISASDDHQNTGRALMCPSIMKSLNITPGFPVLFKTDQFNLLCSAWPAVNQKSTITYVDTSSLTSTSLNSPAFLDQVPATVEAVSYIDLKSVTFTLTSSTHSLTPSNRQLLKQFLLNRFVFPYMNINSPLGPLTITSSSPQGIGKIISSTFLSFNEYTPSTFGHLKPELNCKSPQSSLSSLLITRFSCVFSRPNLLKKISKINPHCLMIYSSKSTSEARDVISSFCRQNNAPFNQFDCSTMSSVDHFCNHLSLLTRQVFCFLDSDLLSQSIVQNLVRIIESSLGMPFVFIFLSSRNAHSNLIEICTEFALTPITPKSRLDLLIEKLSAFDLSRDITLEEISDLCFGLDCDDFDRLFAVLEACTVKNLDQNFNSSTKNLSQSISSISKNRIEFDRTLQYQSQFELKKKTTRFLSRDTFLTCLEKVKESPTSSRHIMTYNQFELPSLDQIIGLEEVKNSLKNLIINPLSFPSLHTFSLNIRPKVLLLLSPPNSGCKLVSQSIAKSIKYNYTCLKTFMLSRDFSTDYQSILNQSFALIGKNSPNLLFIENIHLFNFSTNNLMPIIINSIKNFKSRDDLLFVVSSNCPEDIDVGFLRLVDCVLFVHLPERWERKILLEKFISEVENFGLDFSTVDLDDVALQSACFTSGNLKTAVEKAMVKVVSEGRKSVETRDLLEVLTSIEPVSQSNLSKLTEFVDRFGNCRNIY